MSLFLRAINQARWFKKPDVDWLEDGELKGDALTDIKTENGRLSVYRITNEANTERISVALAATRERPDKVDYAVFADSNLKSLGITVNQTEGKTPDGEVNMVHYELGDLTVKRLAKLAEIISAGKHSRIQQKKIRGLLHESIRVERLDTTQFKPELKEELGRN